MHASNISLHELYLWKSQIVCDVAIFHREKYISTLEMKFNFQKQKPSNIDSLGTKYDLESVMHYGKTAFSKTRGLITIETKDPSKQDVIGNRKGLSKIDVIQINKLYKCGKFIQLLLLLVTLYKLQYKLMFFTF